MAIKEITGDDLSAVESAKIALLDVWATWCGPCKMIAPVVDALSEEFADKVEFFKADADENKALAKKLRVMSIPNVMLFKDGKIAARHVGFQSAEELREWFTSNL